MNMPAHTSSDLYVDSQGQGTELVMLHGWGMHSGVFDNLTGQLTANFRVHRVDLPGHGRSRQTEENFALSDLAELIWSTMDTRLQGPAIWLGWSLGGLIAMQLASQHAVSMRALVLVASTPRFSQAGDWPHAMPATVLAQFAGQLTDDFDMTIKRFLSLQVKGSDDAAAVLRQLRHSVLSVANPTVPALHSGLTILAQADVREQLTSLSRLPVKVILGEQDMLVPAAVRHELARYLPQSQCTVIKGAGHAPFLSHPDMFITELEQFLNELEEPHCH